MRDWPLGRGLGTGRQAAEFRKRYLKYGVDGHAVAREAGFRDAFDNYRRRGVCRYIGGFHYHFVTTNVAEETMAARLDIVWTILRVLQWMTASLLLATRPGSFGRKLQDPWVESPHLKEPMLAVRVHAPETKGRLDLIMIHF